MDQFADLENVSLSVTFFVTLFTAGILGSPHCAGMCGPLSQIVSKNLKQNLTYNFGRLLGYGALGAILGSLGEILLESQIQWIQWSGAVLAILLVLFSIFSVLTGRQLTIPIPSAVRNKLFYFASSQRRILKAFYMGLITTILPCGWLMTFAGVAAATGSALSGAATMAVFWLSTLPIMTIVPLKASRLMDHLKLKSPIAVAVLIAASSFLVIGMRFYNNHSCH